MNATAARPDPDLLRCHLCPGGRDVPATDIADHVAGDHPEVFAEGGDRWPDGDILTYDQEPV